MQIEPVVERIGPMSKASQIFIYILHHTNPTTGMFLRTNGQIQRDLSITQPTVTATMKKLESMGTIRKMPEGGWKVNLTIGRSNTPDVNADYVAVEFRGI